MIQMCCENCKFPISLDTIQCPNCGKILYQYPDRNKKQKKGEEYKNKPN